MKNFKRELKNILEKNKGKRVTQFDYNGKEYWLKQTEELQGVDCILKPFPSKALQREIKQLKYLNKQHAPTAQLVAAGDDYFVTSDVGTSIGLQLKDPEISLELTQSLVNSAATALAELHKKELIHGRPAIRDITVLDEQVYFIDFENKISKKNPTYLKMRDLLIFIHSLYRAQLSDNMVKQAVNHYVQAGDEDIWQATVKFIKSRRWIYWLLLPTKPIAKKDLISAIYTFELILNNN